MPEESLYKRGVNNERYSAGIGYLIIPSNTDRESFIQSCLRTQRVMLYTKNGEVILNVRVGKHLLPDLSFPADNLQLGSVICYVSIPIVNEPIAIAVLSKDDNAFQILDNSFQWIRTSEGVVVSVIGKGDTGQLFINAHTEKENGGDIFINVDNGSKTAKFNLDVKGEINLKSVGKINLQATDEFSLRIRDLDKDEKETLLTYKKGVGLSFVDEFENVLQTLKDGFVVKNSKENIKAILQDLTDVVTNAIIQTPSGPGSIGPTTKQKLNDIKDRIGKLFNNGTE